MEAHRNLQPNRITAQDALSTDEDGAAILIKEKITGGRKYRRHFALPWRIES
jgi:hypothetical protein